MKNLIVLALSLTFIVGCANLKMQDRTPAFSPKETTAQKIAPEGNGAHWSYHGEHGPSHWGDLKEDYAMCKKGTQQSPINLKFRNPASDRTLKFDYRSGPLRVIDNGHTVQVNVDPGNSVVINGEKYELLQFHFHETSEHTISGKHYPMELHFVHKNEKGKLAVVGVMLNENKDGYPHPEIANIWKNIPRTQNKEEKIPSVEINPLRLIPQRLTHYHYQGSLTTPPCSEGVNWNVLNTPIEVSTTQLSQFRKYYTHTNRPVQPWYNRSPANH